MKTSKFTLKSKKIILVLLAAVLAAGLATYGLYRVLTPRRTTIYTFNADYSAGELVTERMLTPVEIDEALVVGSTRLSTGDYFVTSSNYRQILTSAGVLRSDVHAGNALMTSMLTTTGGNPIEMSMMQSAIAVTIGVNYVTAVTSDLSSGSRVNVYATIDGSTRAILQNIRVLSVNKEGGTINAVTLEVNMLQSTALISAYSAGTIHLGLVDATGYQIDSEPPVINSNILLD